MAAVLNTSMKQAAVRAVKAGFKNMKGAAYKKKNLCMLYVCGVLTYDTLLCLLVTI